MAAKFELKRANNGQFMFNLKSANGEVILTSELYAERGSAGHGIGSVKTNAPDDGRYERKNSKGGAPYFVLKAANGGWHRLGEEECTCGASRRHDGTVARDGLLHF